MNAPITRGFTARRIAALAFIVLALAGLAYLRVKPNSEVVSVPAGAEAGQVFLEPCDYPTENGTYPADCGTLVVPENRANPKSRLIALPVTRIHARSDQPGAPIFRLEGGPGKTNMDFPMASRFAEARDVVLVGYRGADGSVRLDCPEVESTLKHSKDLLGEESIRAYGAALRSCATRLSEDGVDLAGYSLTARVDDLEAARIALGYDRVNLVSESAGTRYAMAYSWRYPKSVQRSVMVAVNPPGHFVWDAKTTDEQLRRYADLCAKDEACRARTDDLAGLIGRTSRDIPERWGLLRIKEGNVRVASFYGLVESTPKAGPLAAPLTLDTWLSAADGDASGLWFQSLLADLAFPPSFIWGEMAALGNADARAAQRYFASADRNTGTILGSPGTDFIWGGGKLADAWPAHPDDVQYDRVRTSQVETLLVGGALDFATPPQAATKELLPYLPNGREVVLPGLGHSTSFWTEQPQASTRLVDAFLDSGRVDDSLYSPIGVDFTPPVTHPVLAKGIAGTMIGVALLAVVSLLALAGRVHRRGGVGRRASAILRSAYPIVLGLGGWFGGVLIVLAAMPGVPLDDELLAALSMGLPIGLGVFLAWVNRDQSATKTTGLAAAIGGGLVGAWLGFNATEGFFALLTTLIGATVGSNLLLLALDLASASQVGRRSLEITRVPGLAGLRTQEDPS